MKEVTLSYKRFFRRNMKRYSIPESYNEMSPCQFLAAIRLAKQWINEEAFYMQFFGLTKRELSMLEPYHIYKLSNLLAFIGDMKVAHKEFFVKELPGNLLAPGTSLRGMCFQQFITVDTFFSYYLATEKSIFLDRFVAALYMMPNEAYLPKPGQVGLNLDKRVLEVSAIPFDLKYAILINWVLVKSWLSQTYRHLFPTAQAEANKEGDKIKVKPVDWLTLFDQFVGDNIADTDAYKALACLDAFRIINRKIKEAKR